MIGKSKLFERVIVLNRGKYYGCVQDKAGTVLKKGFETREEARLWITDKTEYPVRWTE